MPQALPCMLLVQKGTIQPLHHMCRYAHSHSMRHVHNMLMCMLVPDLTHIPCIALWSSMRMMVPGPWRLLMLSIALDNTSICSGGESEEATDMLHRINRRRKEGDSGHACQTRHHACHTRHHARYTRHHAVKGCAYYVGLEGREEDSARFLISSTKPMARHGTVICMKYKNLLKVCTPCVASNAAVAMPSIRQLHSCMKQPGLRSTRPWQKAPCLTVSWQKLCTTHHAEHSTVSMLLTMHVSGM